MIGKLLKKVNYSLNCKCIRVRIIYVPGIRMFYYVVASMLSLNKNFFNTLSKIIISKYTTVSSDIRQS